MVNSFSCQWWQETDDIIKVPPTHSNPVPFDFEGCISRKWARELRKSYYIYNRLWFITWKKLHVQTPPLLFCHTGTPLTLYSISPLFPCCRLCITSGAVSQALNSSRTFPSYATCPVQSRGGKYRLYSPSVYLYNQYHCWSVCVSVIRALWLPGWSAALRCSMWQYVVTLCGNSRPLRFH